MREASSRRALLCLGAAICAAALTLPARAQVAPAFGEEIDVRVVNIEVVVTDRDGNRVQDLKPADFLLRVDGKEVPIEYFSEVREARSVAAPAESEATESLQSVAPEGTVGTYYLVFIDDYFLIAPRRDEVLKSLKADLARLGPEDRMAIVAYDGGRLAMLSNWSGSRSDLERAFDQAMARTSRGLDRVVELRALQANAGIATETGVHRELRAATFDDGPADPLAGRAIDTGLNSLQTAYAENLIRQVGGSLGAAMGAMRGFAAPRGRKVMVLLSGGWPFSVVSFIGGGGSLIPSRQMANGEEIFRPMTATANLLGFTLYPVDVPGIQTMAADAEAMGPAGGFASYSEQEIEGTLHFLAKETGGKPILNSNRARALASVSSDTRSYYWLGFSPDWQRNDKSHGVQVEMRRRGLDLRYRTSFRDLSRRAEVSMKLESALLFGSFPGALPMPMTLGTPVRGDKGMLEIPVTLGLPSDVMTVLPVDGKYAAQLELRFVASDASGNSSLIPILPLNLASEKPPAPGKFVRYQTTLKLKGQANHLVVAAYDPLSGKVATAEADLEVP